MVVAVMVPIMVVIPVVIMIMVMVPIAIVMQSVIVIVIIIVMIVMATHRTDAQHAEDDGWENQFEVAHTSPSVGIRCPEMLGPGYRRVDGVLSRLPIGAACGAFGLLGGTVALVSGLVCMPVPRWPTGPASPTPSPGRGEAAAEPAESEPG
jgi:hypothetical protein